jgi:hypothetical protein
MIFKMGILFYWAKKLAFLFKLVQNLEHNILFLEKLQFFPQKIGENRRKIVIITSTPFTERSCSESVSRPVIYDQLVLMKKWSN